MRADSKPETVAAMCLKTMPGFVFGSIVHRLSNTGDGRLFDPNFIHLAWSIVILRGY